MYDGTLNENAGFVTILYHMPTHTYICEKMSGIDIFRVNVFNFNKYFLKETRNIPYHHTYADAISVSWYPYK